MKRSSLHRSSIALLACLTAWIGSDLTAADPARSLLLPQTVAWDDQGLAEGLRQLSGQWHIPIWLDRRVDPRQEVDIQTTAPGWQVLDSIAGAAHARSIVTPSVVIVGHADSVDRIASSLLGSFDAAQASRTFKPLATARPFRWPILSSPREIAREVGRQWKVTVDEDALPHDLWRAADFDSIDGATLLALIGGGFDLQPVFTGKTITWQALPERIPVARKYSIRPTVEGMREEIQQRDPQAKWTVSKGQLTLETSASGHQLLWLATAAKPKVDTPPQGGRYARTEVRNQPAASVIQQIARAEGWELDWGDGTQARAGGRVTFDLTDVLATDVIAEVCQQVQLKWTLKGKTLSFTMNENP